MRDNLPSETASLTLRILDSSEGKPLQSWEFHDVAEVSVGRDPDCDISLMDPKVSRRHVSIATNDGQWVLKSLGRNGTWIDGESVEEVALKGGQVFRLAADGPVMQFVTEVGVPSAFATMENAGGESLDFLFLDPKRTAEDVDEIADGALFKTLLSHSRQKKSSKTDKS